MAECARCGVEFVQRRSDHRFCCPEHRKLGERKPGAPPPVDHEQIARLFDESRDPDELVAVDDWHPAAALETAAEWRELDAGHTVAQRRRWYEELVLLGKV
jgi:hypothetical protein